MEEPVNNDLPANGGTHEDDDPGKSANESESQSGSSSSNSSSDSEEEETSRPQTPTKKEGKNVKTEGNRHNLITCSG